MSRCRSPTFTCVNSGPIWLSRICGTPHKTHGRDCAMQINNIRSTPRLFKASASRFDNVSVETAAQLASLGSDISLLIAQDGTVVDIAYGDSTLASYNVEAWVGSKWRDTVTVESTEKVDSLLADKPKMP